MIRCTVGVMAYNEEHNISQMLHALLDQQVEHVQIVEIVVVASGCTDRTAVRAAEIARSHPLVRVEVQAQRAGKPAAINRLIELAQGDVIVLAGADTLPDPTAIEALVQPFADAEVGMTGARVVPLNDPDTFLGFTVHMLWHLHHHMALRWPKLGELVAFRNIVAALPDSATDEVALESLITARGYRLEYVPEAIVYNRGPQSLTDFLDQRRRIYAGHLQIAAQYNYIAASMPLWRLFVLAWGVIARHPYALCWIVGAALLEVLARSLGRSDYLRGHRHHIWRAVPTTKVLHAQPLTLITVQCRAGSLTPRFLNRLHWHGRSEMALFWWDDHYHQVLMRLCAGARALTPEDSVRAFVDALCTDTASAENPVLSYRIVQFRTPSNVVEVGLSERDRRDIVAVDSTGSLRQVGWNEYL